MVREATDVMDINPAERLDKLDEIAKEKKQTIASKKKELEELESVKKKELEELEKKKQQDLEILDKKRKELAELEKKKLKEIDETEELIETSFQDLMRHKGIIIHEEEEKEKKRKAPEGGLEEVTQGSGSTNIPIITNTNYSKFFENLQQPKRIYEVTNRVFYDGLRDLRNRAANGEITPEEERFVDSLRERFENFRGNGEYMERDQNEYVTRSINIIDQIGKYQRLKID